MITEIDAADHLTLASAWRLDENLPANREIASAKLYATEMLARITDQTLQIFGGMGLMDDFPIERFWRDARVERIWDGTSEIQRHIISRDLLRPLGPNHMAGLDRLFRPKSVAVIGGGYWARSIIEQCRKIGFQGAIYPIHPKATDVDGIPVYRTLADLPETPDAAFICVNRNATIDVVRELSQMGAGGAVCFASGFLESQAETQDGASLQAELVSAAGDMPIVGPNCYGFVNYLDQACLWPDQHGGIPVDSGVAIITQSSNIAINLSMHTRALPIAYLMTAGNQAKVSMADLARFVLADPRDSTWSAYRRVGGSKRIPAIGPRGPRHGQGHCCDQGGRIRSGAGRHDFAHSLACRQCRRGQCPF